jgi:pimeloyl-ACP methyl ester carboxylesterase
MEGLALELADMFDTIRYQQRGQEPTTVREPYSIEAHLDDATAVLDGLGIERAWIIGHSWGGHLGMHLAASRADRTLGLIVVDPLGRCRTEVRKSSRNTSRRVSPPMSRNA